MRANADEQDFARWLLQVGDGVMHDQVDLPDRCIVRDDVVDEIYGERIDPNDVERLRSSVILAPTNEACAAINARANERVSGEERIFRSVDHTPETSENRDLFPVEFVNSLTPSGMPPHVLVLKVGSVVMLLRNLDLKRGLCNGVRMIVRGMHAHALDVELLTGERAGMRAFIPRIRLIPATSQTPVEFIRTQFPVNLAFAMTINKAQGQTFGRVGLSLLQPVFSHGQLYVALSRVRSLASLRVQLNTGTHTKNVVYPEALHFQRPRNHEATTVLRPHIPRAVARRREQDAVGFPLLDEDEIYDFDDT